MADDIKANASKDSSTPVKTCLHKDPKTNKRCENARVAGRVYCEIHKSEGGGVHRQLHLFYRLGGAAPKVTSHYLTFGRIGLPAQSSYRHPNIPKFAQNSPLSSGKTRWTNGFTTGRLRWRRVPVILRLWSHPTNEEQLSGNGSVYQACGLLPRRGQPGAVSGDRKQNDLFSGEYANNRS
jgi:hypothetical protein